MPIIGKYYSPLKCEGDLFVGRKIGRRSGMGVNRVAVRPCAVVPPYLICGAEKVSQ